MPESGAIARVQTACGLWAGGYLPTDFDQLRKDLQHILACIPTTHQQTPAPAIGDTVHFHTRQGHCEAAIVVHTDGDTATMMSWTPGPHRGFVPLTVTGTYYGGHATDDGVAYMPITWHHRNHT